MQGDIPPKNYTSYLTGLQEVNVLIDIFSGGFFVAQKKPLIDQPLYEELGKLANARIVNVVTET